MKIGIHIERAKMKDLDKLTQMLIKLFKIETNFKIAPTKHKKGLKILLNSHKNSIILVARSEAGIIAMVTGQIVISTAAGSPALLVEDLIVDKKEQHQGVGTSLLTSLEKWGNHKGVKRMQLVADNRNRKAIIFYKKQGWSKSQMIGMYKKIES